MTQNIFALLLGSTSLFAVVSCNRPVSEKVNEIKVGMTMEEVEHIVGKPESISPGFRETKDTYGDEGGLSGWMGRQSEYEISLFPEQQRRELGEELENETLQKAIQAQELKRNPDRILALLSSTGVVEVEVQSAGQLNYETWYYPVYDTVIGYTVLVTVLDRAQVLEALTKGRYDGPYEIVPAFKVLRQFGVTFSRAGSRVAMSGLSPCFVLERIKVKTRPPQPKSAQRDTPKIR